MTHLGVSREFSDFLPEEPVCKRLEKSKDARHDEAKRVQRYHAVIVREDDLA